MQYNFKLIAGVVGAIGFSSILYTNYTLSQKFNVLTQQQEQMSLQMKNLSEVTEQKTTELQKQTRILNKRVTTAEKKVEKLTQKQYRELNHKRIVKQFGKVPDVITYKIKTKLKLSDKEKFCLQKNIYHEAANEPLSGMLAVAQVTGNRVESKHRGTDFCSVVYAKDQFSWTRDKSLINSKPVGKEWDLAGEAMSRYINGERIKGLEKSEFYYARYIKSPYWAANKRYTHYIGEHLFLVKES